MGDGPRRHRSGLDRVEPALSHLLFISGINLCGWRNKIISLEDRRWVFRVTITVDMQDADTLTFQYTPIHWDTCIHILGLGHFLHY